MKKSWNFLLVVFLLFFSFSINLASSAEIPDYSDKYLNDFAKIFNSSETSAIRNLLYETDMNTTAEVVLVTADSCVPYSALEYSLKIGEKWKVGKADKDNGLVIAYCKTENKIGVSTGYGLEGILPDSKIGRLLDEYYVPLRDKNQVKDGIIAVTIELVKVIEKNKAEVISGQAGGDSKKNTDWIAVIFWIFFAYVILSKIIARIFKGKNLKKKNIPWFVPIFFPVRTGNSGGGFSSGFGGGGFGGGGFGGGGASR